MRMSPQPNFKTNSTSINEQAQTITFKNLLFRVGFPSLCSVEQEHEN